MANTKEIQDRIKSINDTLKITNAMYMISSSKLKKSFIGCDYDISDLSVLRQLILVGLEIDVLHIRQMPEYSAHL